MSAVRRSGPVLVAIDDDVAVVTIDRPLRSNAIDPDTAHALHQVVQHLESDDSVHAVVLTGAGQKVFCAGSDLRAKAEGAGPAVTGWGFAGFVRAPRTKPWIAAVNGAAVGGGFEIVLACDMALAVPHASFALPEVHRGLVAGGGGLFRLAQRMPVPIATEVLIAGRTLTADEAQQWGLINYVVPAEALAAAAITLARRCGAGAPIALRESLAVARLASGADAPDLWTRAEAASATVATSEDGREGPAAFAAKRPPVWRGR